MTTPFPILKDSRIVSRTALNCQLRPAKNIFDVIMDKHQALHVGCLNKAYRNLPRRTGSDALEAEGIAAELMRLDTIRSNGLPRRLAKEEMCNFLQDFGLVTDAVARVQRSVEVVIGTWNSNMIPATRRKLESNNDKFFSAFMSFDDAFAAWLAKDLHPVNVTCIRERMEFIFAEGLREGDEGHWESCFGGLLVGQASSDTGSAQTSRSFQDTKSALFEDDPFTGIPYSANLSDRDFRDPSVQDDLTQLLELSTTFDIAARIVRES